MTAAGLPAAHAAEPATPGGEGQWQVLSGPATAAEISAALRQLAAARGWHAVPDGSDGVIVTSRTGSSLAAVRWRPATPGRPGTLSHVTRPDPHAEILITPRPGAGEAASLITSALAPLTLRHSTAELAELTASMPLTSRFAAAAPGTSFDGWALIFRDHYVEHSLGFLLAARAAGIPPEWTLALAKGDRTSSRDRVHATLTAHGIRSGVLDNTMVNAPAAHAASLARSLEAVDAFIGTAHSAGRRVLVIDDGGLIAQGYGHAAAPRRVDAAVELTVSGLKRITAAGDLAVPVFNMARSQLKTRLGYPEIADSCLRRLREILPGRKFIGRPVLVLGFGTLGSRLATALAALGCQVHVADTDPLAVISAAESGFCTHRTAASALAAVKPFIVAGTTGYDDALTPADLRLLPDGCFLAPFATRDFALLSEPGITTTATAVPGVGREHALAAGPVVTLPGDGRSLNLFEADSIAGQGYDAYRAGTLIAAAELCRQASSLPPGMHTSPVDDIIAASGLYDAYYDTYLTAPASKPAPDTGRTGTLAGTRACVIGYGKAGQLHAGILATEGAEVAVIDPKHQDLPRAGRQEFRAAIDDLPAAIASGIALWSVCCPTAAHLPSLRSVLARDPRARVLLEKPACQAHEISDLTALLAGHPETRVAVVDQYAHSTVLAELARLIAAHEPGQPVDRITVTFAKDRTADIARGRFIDRPYGVLGYEWLHMLTSARHLIPPAAFTAYLSSDPAEAKFQATHDDRLFVSALTEHATITVNETPCQLLLASTITGQLPGHPPHSTQPPAQGTPTSRIVTAQARETLFTARLAPAPGPDGLPLPLNQHLIKAERAGRTTHERVITDSPMHTAIRHATRALLSSDHPTPPDLSTLRRIAAVAVALRAAHEHTRTQSHLA